MIEEITNPRTVILLMGIRIEVIAILAPFLVGIGQMLLIAFGIWQMKKSSTERSEESKRRHEEVMQSLADEREQNRALMRNFEDQNRAVMRSLEVLIERTAPPPREASG